MRLLPISAKIWRQWRVAKRFANASLDMLLSSARNLAGSERPALVVRRDGRKERGNRWLSK